VCSSAGRLKSRIRNDGCMLGRRAAFIISVTCQTAHEKLQIIADIIHAGIQARPD